MKRSRLELSIDRAIHIFKNHEITLSPFFTFIPKICKGLSLRGISLYGEVRKPLIEKRTSKKTEPKSNYRTQNNLELKTENS